MSAKWETSETKDHQSWSQQQQQSDVARLHAQRWRLLWNIQTHDNPSTCNCFWTGGNLRKSSHSQPVLYFVRDNLHRLIIIISSEYWIPGDCRGSRGRCDIVMRLVAVMMRVREVPLWRKCEICKQGWKKRQACVHDSLISLLSWLSWWFGVWQRQRGPVIRHKVLALAI